jgi:Fe-S cluster assembly protein SufD
MSSATAEPKERFVDWFGQLDRMHPSAALESLREAGRARFRALSLPGPHTEDWRFTNLAPLLRVPLELAEVHTPVDLRAPAAVDRIVFGNGAYQKSLSSATGQLDGLTWGPLSLGAAPRELGNVADYHSHLFTALNTALVHDGFFIVVPEGRELSPIEIVYHTQGGGRPIATQPRTLIVAGKNSRATFIERYVGPDGETYLTNAVTEVVVGAGAVVDHYKVQQESTQAFHIANTQVVLSGKSNFSSHYLGLGGGLVRNEVRVRFDEERAEATVNGVYLAGGRQHHDHFTEIDHARAHCASHELYKGILDGRAEAVFNGKIVVRPDAQKTDAKQTNKVLLLSEDATINTKPQLEIFADDVKCTHGATVGQLDADMIFYLRARGLDLATARRLLTFAFANDIVGRIQVDALRDELENTILATAKEQP